MSEVCGLYMATVVLGRIGPGRKPIWHPRFRDFVRYYGFAAFLCKVRDPDRKGKDERIFDYFEKDFVRGSEFQSFAELNQRAHTWASTIANQRTHGTTRLVPDEVWLAERDFLIKLPETRFATHDDRIQQVGPDSTLSVKGTLYTVPERLHNRAVAVRLYAEHFEVIDPKVQDKVAFSDAVEAHDKGKLRSTRATTRRSTGGFETSARARTRSSSSASRASPSSSPASRRG